jgi:NADH-quinone oxidoreductase subunit I
MSYVPLSYLWCLFETNRGSFIYGKDKLVEKINERIDITERQSEKQKNAVK